MAESMSTDIDKDHPLHKRANYLTQKATLERMILVTNTILEFPSAIFDQLSSVHKPRYALFSMLFSFTVLIISTIDLVYKGRKGRVTLKFKGLLPWFYYPYPDDQKPFGRLVDIIGLICAFFQWVFACITYGFLDHHANNPMKLNVLPMVFAIGLLCSRFPGNPHERKRTPFTGKRRYRDAFVADVISSNSLMQTPLVRGMSI